MPIFRQAQPTDLHHVFSLRSAQPHRARVHAKRNCCRLGKLCFSNDVFVVSDEIHEDLTRNGHTHIPLAKLFPAEKRIITCTSPSKSFNLAGNNHAHLSSRMNRFAVIGRGTTITGTRTRSRNEATIAAYDRSEDWLDELKSLSGRELFDDERMVHEHLPTAKFRIRARDVSWHGSISRLRSAASRSCKKRISRAGVFVQFGEDFVDNGGLHHARQPRMPQERS